jgi:hypothetical protein
MFPKSLILIADHQPVTAMDIAGTVRDTGGHVLGPVDSIEEGLKLADSAALMGAILDCTLRDGEITPLAEVLIGRGVPLVLHTDRDLPDGFRAVAQGPIFRTPTNPLILARKLAQRIHAERQRHLLGLSPKTH